MKFHFLLNKLLKGDYTKLALAALLTFSLFSCKNFFSGSDVLTELEEQMDYLNAPSCTIYFDSSTEYGSFLSSNEKTVKVGYPTTFQFNVKTETFLFSDFSFVDRNDSATSLNDYVDFTITSSKEEIAKGIIKARITVVKPNNNILVKTSCLPLPCVISGTPAPSESAYFANTPIIITFNNEIKPESVTAENIYIKSNGENISRFFESPVLSNDSKTITIKSKALELVQFIQDTKTAFINVNVTVTDAVKSEVAGAEYSIIQDERVSWNFRYKPEVETTPPEKFNLEFSSIIPEEIIPAISEEALLTQKHFSNFTEEDLYTNFVQSKIFITGRYFDADSGIASVIVEEVRTNKKDATPITRKENDKTYDFLTTFTPDSETDQLYITYEEDGYATFAIPYTLKTKEDGAIKLSVKVLDACTNSSKAQEITVIQSYIIDISRMDAYNYDMGNKEHDGRNEDDQVVFNVFTDYNLEEHKKALKTIHIKKADIQKNLYGNFIDSTFIPEPFVEYKDKSGNNALEPLLYNSETEEYYIELNVSSVENLEFQIKIANYSAFTDTNSKTFLFPGKVAVYQVTSSNVTTKQLSLYTTGTIDEYYCYCDSFEVYKCAAISSSYSIHDNSREYSFFARNGSLIGEHSNRTYSFEEPVSSMLPATDLFFTDVQLAPIHNGEENIYINMLCYVDSSLWDKYDSLFLTYKHGTYYQSNQKFFGKNSTVVTIRESFNNRWDEFETIILYGVDKTGQSYKGCTFVLPAIKELEDCNQYETISPTVTDYSSALNYNTLSALDFKAFYPYCNVSDSSGIKTIDYWTADNPTVRFIDKDKIVDSFTVTFTNNVSTTSKNLLPVPLTDTKEDETIYYIHITDTLGNVRNLTKIVTIPETNLTIQDFVKDATPEITWTISLNPESISVTNRALAFHYVFTDNGWSHDTAVGGGYKGYAIRKSDPQLTNTTDLPQNKWVKFQIITHTTEDYYKCNSMSAEKFLYTGPESQINSISFGADSVLLYSDQPVLIRLLATEYPYETCKNWTCETWEKRPIVIDEEVYSPAGNTQHRFGLENNYSKIPEKAFFVIIAHFADGTVKMSDVRQKK